MEIFLDDAGEGIYVGGFSPELIAGEPLSGEVRLLPFLGVAARRQLLVGNSLEVQLKGLRGTVSGAPALSATVRLTVSAVGGSEVSGADWPLALSAYDDGASYRVYLPHSVSIEDGGLYKLVLTAEAGGSRADWEEEVVAAERSVTHSGKLVTR